MIDKLTKEQESKIPYYFNKWYKIGHEYKKIDREYAKEILKEYLAIADIKPKYFLFFDSPFACELSINIMKNHFTQLDQQFNQQLNQRLYYQFYYQLNQQFNQQLNQQFNYQLYQQLIQQLYLQLYYQLNQQFNQQFDQQLDHQFNHQLYNQFNQQLYQQLDLQLFQQFDQQLNKQLDQQPFHQIFLQLYYQLNQQLYLQLYYQLNQQLDHQFNHQPDQQIHQQLNKIKFKYYPIYYWSQSGNINSGYCAFYDFIESEIISLDSKTQKIFQNFKKVVSELHYFWVFKDFVFCSEKPIELFFNENNQLHKDLSASVKYADDYSLYSLNGVNVDKEIVMTSANELDCNLFYKIDNVEIRQEFVKKVGLNRLAKELNFEVIEKINANDLYHKFPITNYIQQGDQVLIPEYEVKIDYKNLNSSFKKRLKDIQYELINMKVKNEYRPYLKMTNASIPDEMHIEGVNIDCKNVFQAICYRNKKKTSLPCFLS
jgi:hypothetical protein